MRLNDRLWMPEARPERFTSRRRAFTDVIKASPHDLGMNINSMYVEATATSDTSPILIIPYMWIGDFVRGHTVVRVLKERWPNRPVDLLTTSQCAPLVDYMPGVRSGIVWDLPRRRLALARQWGLASL